MRAYTSARSPAGFTMLELLIAVLVLSILVTIVYLCFASVLDTAEAARANAEVLRFRQFLWRSFTTNLASIYADPGCVSAEYQFLGANEDGYLGPADTLRFCTVLPMAGPKSLPGVLRVVEYAILDTAEMEEGGTLGEYDIDVRRARLKEIQRRMLASAIRFMPVTRTSVWAVQPWVRNFHPNLSGFEYAHWASVWLEP